MNFRINANSCKNAMGTVFLLAAAFFVCSTFISMRSVFADPIVSPTVAQQRSGRASPRNTNASRATTARTTTSRATASRTATSGVSRTTTLRGTATRNVSSRAVANGRASTTNNVVSRGVSARNQASANRAVRARTSSTPARVSVSGNVMTGSRASSPNSVSYLASSLYTGSYSSIIDSSTGLISADAYSNCMESYYTCMDEICTARSDTKGRCSCAGRATSFLEAEDLLDKANEELIKLSGQLSLLIATKGKGEDLASAFSLTDAEKVMNCVSYRENVQTGEMSDEDWYTKHPTVSTNGTRMTSGMPLYCKESGNNFGFDISNINGSGSDILAQLQAWADAKDLAKQYTNDDTNDLLTKYTTISGVVSGMTGITTSVDSEKAKLDSLTNKWGYDLFQYAHNNVCGRVLDSCFNGIYEACGNPGSYTIDGTSVSIKCGNGGTASCPFNYNSYVSVKSGGKDNKTSTGEVVLKDSNTMGTSVSSSASCFGYSTTSTTTTRSGVTTSNDPYATLRGPVADARRSIMQKYLLDANAACDVYGAALKTTAQNINYQKIAAEQALQQKRLEFKQEAEATTLADATTAGDNFNECLSEILDCYETQSNNTTSSGANWTEARIKTYCAQIAQVPHCYETMICSPSTAQFHAVIDKPDNSNCFNSQDYRLNTCRNVVTISEILNTASSSAADIAAEGTGNSAAMREQCLRTAGVDDIRGWSRVRADYVQCTLKQLSGTNASAGYTDKSDDETCKYITQCKSGYVLRNDACVESTYDCTSEIEGAASAIRTLGSDNVLSKCKLQSCKANYTKSDNNTCIADTDDCTFDDLRNAHAVAGSRVWNGTTWGDCVYSACESGYSLVASQNKCMETNQDCTASHTTKATKSLDISTGTYGTCRATECEEGYTLSSGMCVANQE